MNWLLTAHAQTLYQLPSSTTIFAGVGNYSEPWFVEWLPIGYFIIGVLVGSYVVLMIITAVRSAFEWLAMKFTAEKKYES